MISFFLVRYFPLATSLCLLSFCISHEAYALDSTKILSPDAFLKIVLQYNPVAIQAGIQVKKATEDILISRGNFDPVLSTSTSRKTFDGTEYYNYINPEIIIPTWYGIEVHTGIETLNGKRLDPTETAGQTSYLGISIPLLKDLVLDKRRALLQQAKIYKLIADAGQKSVINNLLLESMEAYWQWAKSYKILTVIKSTVEINERRFDFVKKMVANGERPAIDTIEALTQLQYFQLELNNALLDVQNNALQLSAYLWNEKKEPYYLPEDVIPTNEIENESSSFRVNVLLTDLETFANKYHPELLMYELKLKVLNIDRKLKSQQLLPKLDFNYNLLGKGYNVLKTTSKAQLFENNYNFGFKFEMPLRLSSGRGEFKKSNLKIEETRLAQYQKQRDIQIKIRSYYNELLNLEKQIELQTQNYFNYKKLVTAEETRLQNGESSLFLINSRETKALEAFEKLIELKAKFMKKMVALKWSAGFPR